MRGRDLLAAIAGIDPIRIQGTFERHTSLRWEELKPSVRRRTLGSTPRV